MQATLVVYRCEDARCAGQTIVAMAMHTSDRPARPRAGFIMRCPFCLRPSALIRVTTTDLRPDVAIAPPSQTPQP